MKYYNQLAKKPSFTFDEATKVIGDISLTEKSLSQMIEEGSLHRVRRNLYTCVNLATGSDCASPYQIASKINDNSFVSYHSAFEFFGFYNQMYFQMQVSSDKRFSDFSYDDYSYKSFISKTSEEIETIQEVKVTSIERTIVDSIDMLGKVMDTEELLKCISLVHYVEERKILKMLEVYGKEILYRKVGYILSYFQKDFLLSDAFFKICKEKGIPSNKGVLVRNDKASLVFNSEWGLYTYKDLGKLAYKGGEADV